MFNVSRFYYDNGEDEFSYILYVTGVGGSGTKTAGKGLDMDAVGNINSVPVYEFDLDGLKVEDKPWRKPGMPISLLLYFLHYVCKNVVFAVFFFKFLFLSFV